MEIINTFNLTDFEERKIAEAIKVVDEIFNTLNNQYWKRGFTEPYEYPRVPKSIMELYDKLQEIV